jgi:hypothetical protein
MRWSGSDGGYRDLATGAAISSSDASKRIARLGLERVGDSFRDIATGAIFDWDTAHLIIKHGTPEAA